MWKGWRAGVVLVLATVVIAMVAESLRERHNAPAVAPLPLEASMLADVTLLDPTTLRTPPPNMFRLVRGAATSLSEDGLWVTAATVVQDCRSFMVMVTPFRGLPARLLTSTAEGVALLHTNTGAPAVPLGDRRLGRLERGFHPGFPRQIPGELTSRKLGDIKQNSQMLDYYAEAGRTEGLDGGVGGGVGSLAGTPVLDEQGRVEGITLGDVPRRGRLFAAPLSAIRLAVASINGHLSATAEARAVTVDNYGLVGDALRRAGSVAGVVCLDGWSPLTTVRRNSLPRGAPVLRLR